MYPQLMDLLLRFLIKVSSHETSSIVYLEVLGKFLIQKMGKIWDFYWSILYLKQNEQVKCLGKIQILREFARGLLGSFGASEKSKVASESKELLFEHD